MENHAALSPERIANISKDVANKDAKITALTKRVEELEKWLKDTTESNERLAKQLNDLVE
jgi:septal ring factor EnvC (AmiA/AmiB activator)